MNTISRTLTLLVLLSLGVLGSCSGDVEQAVKVAQAAPEEQQEESYQRVYEAFDRLMQTVSHNSIGNMKRLVKRLNSLVGQPADTKQLGVEETTEQVLSKLDQMSKEKNQHTLSQLNEDVGRLIGSINESYLRNIRRVFERVNRLLGERASTGAKRGDERESDDRLEEPNGGRLPGFPGWDELIVAVDRMQKSLAQFVRSSTKLVTSG